MGSTKSHQGKKKRILLIGYGSIGKRHLSVAREVGNHSYALLRSGKGIKEGDGTPQVEEFKDIKPALDWKPTHVVICTPTQHHLDYFKEISQTEIPVLIEKPFISEINILEEKGLYTTELEKYPGMVGYNLRFHSVFQKVKEVIEKIIAIIFK